MDDVFGGALEWRPVRGLRLKATGLKQRSSVLAEYHSIDGAGRLSPFENPQGLTRNWRTFVAKATCHF